MPPTKAHCNRCGGARNHEVLHSEETSWEDEEYGISGSDRYEMLRCLGCENITLRHSSWVSENDYPDEPTVSYFPPAIFRQSPDWLSNLPTELLIENGFVEILLREIYAAIQNNLPNLAAMGVRSLLEKVMISKVGDNQSFIANVAEFEKLGYVSRLQRERLEAIIDVGNATIHRDYTPTTKEIITLVDITEHIIEAVYIHEPKIEQLKKVIPPRPPRPKNESKK